MLDIPIKPRVSMPSRPNLDLLYRNAKGSWLQRIAVPLCLIAMFIIGVALVISALP